MRKDESGNPCPATLGEYRRMCAALGGENCEAVRLLDEKIQGDPDGEDAKVVIADSQMRSLLMPLLTKPAS